MAARVSTIWFIDSSDARAELSTYPQPDQSAALATAKRLYPGKDFESLGPHPLSTAATVQPGYVFVGVYQNISVVCSTELSSVLPSELPATWLLSPHAPRTLLVSSVPGRAQGSFALWEDGQLRRSFSALPIDIVENIGIPETWELPYWAGEHPLRYPPGVLPDPQSLPFHPQQFAEAANAEWLGFRYTGTPHDDDLDKTQILLWGFKIHQKVEAPKITLELVAPKAKLELAAPKVEPEPKTVSIPEPAPAPEPEPTPEPTPEPEAIEELHPPIEELETETVEPIAEAAEPIVDAAAPEPSAPEPAAPEPSAPQPKKRGRLARYFGFH
ncbi:DUF6928 family protein [Rhodococcus sp. OK302]|uniref:DUF6928 family protein n=1 Tax=Rhodococcus sp. OK302 TaxID=1882769 RepID=UPI000B9F2CDD|nr:hypothetical protein [Rhodococcus sp. OK302]OYD68393.1 hypothetical protein BDB13_1946 [Rhodococcus sp. OK302]